MGASGAPRQLGGGLGLSTAQFCIEATLDKNATPR